jgi:hypothetical protein
MLEGTLTRLGATDAMEGQDMQNKASEFYDPQVETMEREALEQLQGISRI